MNFLELIHKSVFALIESGIFLGSLGAVLFVNRANSAFSLGSVFTCISLLYLVSNADFVAAAQSLVYVGAINVLIVFAVMITDEPTNSYAGTATGGIGYFAALVVSTTLFATLAYVIYNTEWFDSSLINESGILASRTLRTNVQELGYKLLNEFLVPFELVSILLLVALMGAINPARNERFTTEKKFYVSSSHDKSSFFQ
uniref:NAD(P)H-quinone oxidoreductase subunit 6, chloroplastic n=1 Tax=Gastoniella chaerophylla TaxID=170708 RepID=A0A3G5CS49_9MONI|nr:NADH-plastoquinone oxidoreductase subunit 6 [Gastoniella chaerophylla]AYW15693.1 NADH-plastoquinone oxidoreductase subunit 6 [Gastoniella chaerophylla]